VGEGEREKRREKTPNRQYSVANKGPASRRRRGRGRGGNCSMVCPGRKEKGKPRISDTQKHPLSLAAAGVAPREKRGGEKERKTLIYQKEKKKNGPHHADKGPGALDSEAARLSWKGGEKAGPPKCWRTEDDG